MSQKPIEVITGAISFNYELLFSEKPPPINTKNEYSFSLTLNPGSLSKLSLFLDGNTELVNIINLWLSKANHRKLGDIVGNIYSHDSSERGYIHLDIATCVNLRFGDQDQSDISLDLNGIVISEPQTKQGVSVFSLSLKAHHLVESCYSLNEFEHFIKREFSWLPKLNKAFPIPFGQIKFSLEHKFSLPNGSRNAEVVIKKSPLLIIQPIELTAEDICKHARAICTLLSLYLNENIDFHYSKVSGTHGVDYLYWSKTSSGSIQKKGKFSHLFHYDWINWIQNFDTVKAVNEETFLRHIVPRFNLAMASNGETRFMLLYNILELIRNKTIDSTKNRNRLSLIKGKSKVEREIKQQLKALQHLISNEDREIFLNSLDGKAAQILYRPMHSQFDTFMKKLNLSADNYGVNFKELIKLRNEIFHGSLTSIQSQEVSEINQLERFPALVFCCLLRFLGYKNIPKFG